MPRVPTSQHIVHFSSPNEKHSVNYSRNCSRVDVWKSLRSGKCWTNRVYVYCCVYFTVLSYGRNERSSSDGPGCCQPSWCGCNTVVSTGCGWQVVATPEPRQGFAWYQKKLEIFTLFSGEAVGKAVHGGDALTAAGVAKHAACYAAKQAGPSRAIKSGSSWVFNKLHATMHLHSLSCSKALAVKGQKCRAGGLKPTQTAS